MGKPIFVDTHCHLDAHYFPEGSDAVIARARAAGLGADELGWAWVLAARRAGKSGGVFWRLPPPCPPLRPLAAIKNLLVGCRSRHASSPGVAAARAPLTHYARATASSRAKKNTCRSTNSQTQHPDTHAP